MALLTKLIRTGNDFLARIQQQKTQPKQQVLIELLQPVKTVDKAANHQEAWLIVLPDKRNLQVGGLKYFARIYDTHVQPTTWRIFTVDGYQFDYPKEVLKYPNYYLVMEGSKIADGIRFIDAATAKRFNDLISILKSSGDFDRIGTKTLPDGSVLVLYKRKPIEVAN